MARPLRLKGGGVGETNTEHQIRDQEVMRANKELAAYFKGRRTEREARAALKTIKAFVRDRERADPKSRRPLPGSDAEAVRSPGARNPATTVRAGKSQINCPMGRPRRA